VVLTGLAACGEPDTASAFVEGPRGYIEFYLPERDAGDQAVHRDVQVFHLRGGAREFLGMTRKWSELAEARRGLTATLAPGHHDFVLAAEGAETPVRVEVENGAYHRVRIVLVPVDARHMIGATQQVQFRIEAEVQAPRQ
jgi:hypothetical protein